MGRKRVGKPQGIVEQRMARNSLALRQLVDARPSRVVRAGVEADRLAVGKSRPIPHPRIGFRSGHLVVTGYVRSKTKAAVSCLVVRCDCGRPEYTLATRNLRTFASTRCMACGNEKAHATRKAFWKYAEAMPDYEHRRRLCARLAAAITRCHVPTAKQYPAYGGRGITVCREWRADRTAFLRYIQTISGWDDPSLQMDRKDNRKGYKPGNIRFVSRAENNRNRRTFASYEKTIARLRSTIRRLRQQIHDLDRRRAGVGS